MISGDIVQTSNVDTFGAVVVGWFTPDYRPLAEEFSRQLSQHQAPHHLFAKSKGVDQGWSTKLKPSVVREAMDLYPGRVVVLMDVDCIVRGDIRPMVHGNQDVGITAIARDIPEQKQFINLSCSSRVVVFRPTDGARQFVAEWQRRVALSRYMNDEHAMVWAFLASIGTSFSYIDRRYSGREITDRVAGAVILHDSAHEKARRVGSVREAVKEFERRWLRTGRTAAAKAAGHLSVQLQDGFSECRAQGQQS